MHNTALLLSPIQFGLSRHRCRSLLHPFIFLLTGLSGCTRSPSQNIVGSFFPAWLLCAALGCGAAVLARLILGAVGLDQQVFAPPLAYVAVAVAAALFIWLFQFGQ